MLTYRFPFFSGTEHLENMPSVAADLNAGSSLFLIVLTAILIGWTLFTISFYKNRKKQLLMTIIDLVLSVGLIVLYFGQLKKFDSGSVSLTSIFLFAIPVLLFLAARGIRKDEQLVKSLDRLR